MLRIVLLSSCKIFRFVWRKKIEHDVSRGLSLDMLSVKAEKKRQQERMFHFEQSKIRSEIRLREGRTKPIDILSKNLNVSDDFDVEINEPYTRDAIDRARVRGEKPPPEVLAEERGLHSSIETDARRLLEAKTLDELEALQRKIESQMLSGTAKVVEFWEAVLKRLPIYKAKVYWWHDKYRPRKPKYFNRVHTGYEWNKYNQTHYDHDNPPPKIVQGYKFNIFYPDLVDKSKAPVYTIERDGSNGETCLIRFHAGPPYEDIAFRIVNKEWEYSHKKGFKCTFERGILHVYFNFKRHRYRR
ncbi:unnamed protein product [Spirodela intermedia]|uniref:Splicing factor Cactin n=1 Tax=Spirodela intermedia TaxID=51605 RepID=A0A7I8JQA1_SPIIN|nr:unnamed protein product [Spirodela intermedia]CAA6672344.1 unnamed protein product [Spirodela intermedia]